MAFFTGCGPPALAVQRLVTVPYHREVTPQDCIEATDVKNCGH